ncbi:MAG: copper homeostasis protein CutC [Bacteroidetes bacterium]|nr:copper homeostasis protein CutC [Bacteroidota bacterium]MBU1719289.1 copper homeostasis protein CutC [Bacteroidota bacterium]
MLEICTAHLQSVISATKAGADRIELCTALPVGGITPTTALIKAAKSYSHLPIMVLIRPREGDFVYSDNEKQLYLSEIEACVDAGADGIVLGALTISYALDITFLKEIIALIDRKTTEMNKPRPEIVFHRAFDYVESPFDAMEILIACGFTRILTSGQKPTATEGKHLLKRLVELAENRITIMPGGGINSQNINELKSFTGAKEFHLSAKTKTCSTPATSAFNVDLFSVDPEEVKAVKHASYMV